MSSASRYHDRVSVVRDEISQTYPSGGRLINDARNLDVPATPPSIVQAYLGALMGIKFN